MTAIGNRAEPAPMAGLAPREQARRYDPGPPPEDDADPGWAMDDLLEGMRDGRYGGRPLDGPGPAALVLLLHALGWRPDGRAFAAALPHFPPRFGVREIRETLLRLGFVGAPRRMIWRDAQSAQRPALAWGGSGSPHILLTDATGRLRAIDPATGRESRLLFATRVTVISFRPAEPGAAAEGGRRLGRFLGAHRRDLAVLFAITTLSTVLVLGGSLAVRAIYDHVIPSNGYDTLAAIGVIAACALALDLGLRAIKARISANVSARLLTRVGSAIFAKLLRLPLERLTGAPVSAQLDRIRQFESFQAMLSGPIAAVAVETPFIFAITLALFLMAGPLFLIPIVVGLLLGLLAMLALPGQRVREARHAAARRRFQTLMVEASTNAMALRAYGLRTVWTERLRQAAAEAARCRRRAATRRRMAFLVANATGPAATASVAIIGAALVMAGDLTMGALVGATILVNRATAPLQQAFAALWSAQDLGATYAQVDRLLAMPDAVEQPAPPVRRSFRGAVRLERLSYRHPGQADAALAGIELSLGAGVWAAVTGPAGAGKSTLLKVMAGLHAPQSGSVFIDDVNLRQMAPGEVRAIVGFAPDDPPLFHGSIAQNLRLGDPTAHRGRLLELCEELGAGPWLAAMPDGLDTRLDHAVQATLPAGFQQTLGIARALLARPRLLLLDQPATALDAALERALLDALAARRGETTIVVVTHRPSQLRLADVQIALDDGRLARCAPPAGARSTGLSHPPAPTARQSCATTGSD
ncbi:peptidase domain-containing ABC transporter [Rubrimonas cliftonensis]|uniref:ATP-binding cassette, subfamily B/ATP-binding cassette, subfamily C, LapB n=1 Tax=Rubrimonas cliftonensis TaxID=89524 RepID=A0A1H4DJJ5_9RHOB|nr:ATP-binding cassette domain-containing protein [Rubrimonas cliftonensis]SEA73003.1 ATP-binding cassette, subfamily B/ATP-binding cassette, subfamily C, LapB [Rubrimonas cliftonensis]